MVGSCSSFPDHQLIAGQLNLHAIMKLSISVWFAAVVDASPDSLSWAPMHSDEIGTQDRRSATFNIISYTTLDTWEN
jgi:hypothetical protein